MSNNINTDNMLRVGTVLHGTYRIDRYLSSGGFGNTYVATNIQFGEQYAIKEFFMRGISQRDNNNTTVSVSNTDNSETFASQLEKFKKEARRLRKLNNEHIVRVHDLFEENGTAYYVMDYIDGENLSDRLKRTGKPLSEAKVMQFLPQILDALEAAHKEGILHLDLKPANIMVDRQGVVRLIDFGASKQQSAQGGATTSTAVSYTNGYAPREQMEQNLEKFGPWTDFYALGATLYDLLTNNHPPMTTDIDDDRSADKHLALPLPSDLSAKTKHLILWMMNTDRAYRPQSVAEIKDFLAKDYVEKEKPKPIPEYGGETIGIQETSKPQDESVHGSTPNKKTATKPRKGNSNSSGPTPLYVNGKRLSRRKLRTASIWGVVIVAMVTGVILGVTNDNSNGTPSAPTVQNSLSEEKQAIIDNLVNNMVKVEGGTFTMGATPEQGSDVDDDSKPAHQVTLSSYYIGKYEVTQEEWQAVMGNNPSYFKGKKRPVEQVSWNDCQKFIKKLNEITGKSFRLPTEAEWEFAARGGNHSRGYKYAGSSDLASAGWYDENSGNGTHAVGGKSPNELGLYDMSGNVWECCQDWDGDYSSREKNNPKGPASGSRRVIRGGSWDIFARDCRVPKRLNVIPSDRDCGIGLRLAL